MDRPVDQQGENSGTPSLRQRQLANVRKHQFKPGKSGNPKGRPRRLTFTEICHKYLGAKADDVPERTRMEVLAERLYAMALKGNMKAAALILSRVAPVSLRIRREELTQLVVNLQRADPPSGWPTPELANAGALSTQPTPALSPVASRCPPAKPVP